MKKLFGVVTPLSTPMDQKEHVDYDSLENLCKYLIDHGINGLYPNGTTGEVVYLTIDERKKILEHTIKAASGRATVFSMVGAATTSDTIELARHAEQAGADGIGVVTPYYLHLCDDELFNHYLRVAQSVSADFPVYLYAIPQLAANDISIELAERIAAACPNVVGIKYSYPDMPRMLRFLDIRDHTFSVLTGPDDLFFSMLAAGGDGTISGNSNVIPEYYSALYHAFLGGDYGRAAKLQDKILQLNSALSAANGLACYKACLVYRGVIQCAKLRSPLSALPQDETEKLLGKMEALHFTDPAL